MTPAELRRRLHAGEYVPDVVFDALLPEPLRKVSERFWTPLDVARRVAEWLSLTGARNVLDIGSGAGKFCVAAALTSDLSLVGIEHRTHLVAAARNLAAQLGVARRTRFLAGKFDARLVQAVDALYLFNPFEENLFRHDRPLDDTVELSSTRFLRDIRESERVLASVAPGTRVVTYNGFGGRLCASYALANKCTMHGNPLRLWIKTRHRRHGRWWCEDADEEYAEEDEREG